MRPLLGVIGGLGPLASVYFYEMLTKMQTVEKEQDYADILLYSKPSTPDRTAYITGQSADDPLPALLEAGRALDAAGVSLIAIPCVTAHFFYEALCGHIQAPILDMVSETADSLARRGVKKAGVLATDGTLRAGLFTKALNTRHISVAVPAPDAQAGLMRLIYQHIKRGQAIGGDALTDLADGLRADGAETVLLGCTELCLAARGLDAGFTDTLAVLARASLKKCGVDV